MVVQLIHALAHGGGWLAAASPALVAVALLAMSLAEMAAARNEDGLLARMGAGRLGLVTSHAAERSGARRWGRLRRNPSTYRTHVW